MNVLEFLKCDDNKKVIIANKISTANALVRQVNINDNEKTFDRESKTVVEIAKEMVSAYNTYKSIAENKRYSVNYVTRTVALYLVENVLRNGSYKSFPSSVFSMQTYKELYTCINEFRLNKIDKSFYNAADQKTKDFAEILEKYNGELLNNNFYDDARLYDEAMGIIEDMKADKALTSIEELLPWIKETTFGNLETNVFHTKEFEFINALIEIAGVGPLITIDPVAEQKKSEIDRRFIKAYGIPNEIKAVIKDIKEKGKAYGYSAVYYSSPEYISFLQAAFDSENIPYALTGGVPAVQLRLVQFMLSILKSARNDYLFADLKGAMVNSCATLDKATKKVFETKYKKYFAPIALYKDAISSNIGWGKDRYVSYCKKCDEENEAIDEIIRQLDNISSEEDKADKYNELLEKHEIKYGQIFSSKKNDPQWLVNYIKKKKVFSEFLKDYIAIFEGDVSGEDITIEDIFDRLIKFTFRYTTENRLEKLVIEQELIEQCKCLHYLDNAGKTLNEKLDVIIDYLENAEVNNSVDPAKVSISPINSFFVMERPENYLVGMNANSFAVDTKQSPIMFDDEKMKYLNISEEDVLETAVLIKTVKNAERRQNLKKSIDTLRDGSITMLYSFFDTVALKDQAPSVFYLEELAEGSEEKAEGYDYIDEDIRVASEDMFELYKKAAKDAEDVDDLEDGADNKDISIDTEDENNSIKSVNNVTSASAIQTLLHCPLEYYYEKVCYLYENEIITPEPYKWLNPLQRGTFFHELLENYINKMFENSRILSAEVDENLVDELFKKQVKKTKEQVPYPSEAIVNIECSENISKFKEYLSGALKRWSGSEKKWQIIGCEVKFDKLPYSDNSEAAYKYDLLFNGSIDRLDAYVSTEESLNVVNLRIIDYKTGNKDNKEKEIKAFKQIQHYVYAMAAIEYIKNNQCEIEKQLKIESIDKIKFESIVYEFIDANVGDDVIDVLKIDDAKMTIEGDTLEDIKVDFPDYVKKQLRWMFGTIQSGNDEVLQKEIEKIFEYVAALREIEGIATKKINKAISEKEKKEKALPALRDKYEKAQDKEKRAKEDLNKATDKTKEKKTKAYEEKKADAEEKKKAYEEEQRQYNQLCQELSDRSSFKKNIMDDLLVDDNLEKQSHDYKLDELCKYCNYKEICRMHLRPLQEEAEDNETNE